ncbi:hypothetical protein [Streptomyces sp. NPDC059816]
MNVMPPLPIPPAGDDWESSLAHAFGVLLDRPLPEFDAGAEYVFVH